MCGMARNGINFYLEMVSEQVEQSFQMLHNALFMRQNQILSQLSSISNGNDDGDSVDENETNNIEKFVDDEKFNQVKFFGIKMDDVLREIREFGTISMTSVDPKLSTITKESLSGKYPINEDIKLSLILKNSEGQLVTDRGILDPKIHLQLKHLPLPWCEIIDSDVPHSIDLNVRLPQVGEYELSVQFCESSILGSPFTLIGSFASSKKPVASLKPREATQIDYLLKVGSRGIKPSDFGNPQAIITSNDRILVTDSGNSCIQIYSDRGEYITCFGPKEKKNGRILRPIDIAETSNGHYLITDFEMRVILVYDLSGNYVSSFGQKVLLGPKGICVDKSGQIIVADNKDSSLVFFRATGKFIRKLKDKSRSENKLSGPHFLTVMSSGEILVTDFHNHCVKIFDKNGIYVKEFGKHGENWGEFSHPTGICCSEKDEIFVSDWGNSRIMVFNNLFMCTSMLKCREEPLNGPQGIAYNRKNTQILIVDSGNHCFKVFQYQ